jgi:hypothetical protein
VVGRRRFLQLTTALAVGMTLDPERLLWVPGAKTYFIPDPTIVTAKTMAEALSAGLSFRVPDDHGGWRDLYTHLAGPNLEERLRAEIASVEAMGGHVVRRRTYTAQELGGRRG